MDEFQKILGKFGLSPKNLSFYQTAFIHRSFLNETKGVWQSNERLEFLGDAILSFIVSSFLFQKRAKDQEGDLTNLRSYIVKTESLAQIARQLKLGRILRLSKGEELSGGRENPQILADTFEAILGAIYLDLGMEHTAAFVKKTLLLLFEKEIERGAPRDPKSRLQEVVQSRFQSSPRYKVLQTTGPDHAKQFTVGVFLKDKEIGQGRGASKQQAEEEAAEKALAKLVLNNASCRKD